jgi:hypothetical protein
VITTVATHRADPTKNIRNHDLRRRVVGSGITMGRSFSCGADQNNSVPALGLPAGLSHLLDVSESDIELALAMLLPRATCRGCGALGLRDLRIHEGEPPDLVLSSSPPTRTAEPMAPPPS